jgi:hypothetical protein
MHKPAEGLQHARTHTPPPKGGEGGVHVCTRSRRPRNQGLNVHILMCVHTALTVHAKPLKTFDVADLSLPSF